VVVCGEVIEYSIRGDITMDVLGRKRSSSIWRRVPLGRFEISLSLLAPQCGGESIDDRSGENGRGESPTQTEGFADEDVVSYSRIPVHLVSLLSFVGSECITCRNGRSEFAVGLGSSFHRGGAGGITHKKGSGELRYCCPGRTSER